MKLLFLNGWSMPASVWKNLRTSLTVFQTVEVLDTNQALDLDQWMALIDAKVSKDTVLMGWSLGGMLAMHYAGSSAKPFRGMVSLMANPVFVQQQDWPVGMPGSTFAQFRREVSDGESRQWQRTFSFLLSQGMREQRSALRRLDRVYQQVAVVEEEVLDAGLSLLAELDVRSLLASIKVPCTFVFGESDAFARYSPALNTWLPPEAHLEILPGVAHCPFLNTLHEQALYEFLNQQVNRFCPTA